MRLFENINVTLSPKRFTFYALFLAYGFYLLWSTIPGTINSISSIINPIDLSVPQAGLMAGVIQGIDYTQQLIFTYAPHVIGGILLIITYFSYIYSKNYARGIGILGSCIYLIYPIYRFSNFENIVFSLSFVQFIVHNFLPVFILIVLTIVYWKKLDNKEAENKERALTFSVRRYTFYAFFLTLGLMSLAYFLMIARDILELGLSFWMPDQQFGVIIIVSASFISSVLLLLTYYRFLYSKKYEIYTGLVGCIFFIVLYLDLSSSLLLQIYYIIPPIILILIMIVYWKKLT